MICKTYSLKSAADKFLNRPHQDKSNFFTYLHLVFRLPITVELTKCQYGFKLISV